MISLDGPWSSWERPDQATSLTIGVLDGVHRGHRSLLARLDKDLLPTVVTFDPHPLEVLRPEIAPKLITTLPERVALLRDAGVGCVASLDLADIKDLGPEQFVEDILIGALAMKHLVVGEDFRFGRDRKGDAGLLAAMAEERGFRCDVLELIDDEREPISSSRIRGLIEAGHIAAANELLGSRFRLTSVVVDGDKRGRSIGFPTANLRPPDRKLVPGDGVYACHARLGKRRLGAAVNVGVRPTFGGGERLIEAYLIDFDDDIYGNELTIEFVEYLRPELQFDGVEALVEAMRSDVAEAKLILESDPSRI